MQKSFWVPVIYFLIGIISVQGSASLAKSLFYYVSPQGVTALRLGFSAIILMLVCRPWRRKIPEGAWRPIVEYGIALGCMNSSFYMAIARIPLGIAVAIEFTGPLVLAACASRSWKEYIWVILAVLGVLLLMPFGEFNADLDPVGVAFGFGAGFFWALYIIFGKKAGASIHGIDSVAIGTLIAAVLILPLGFASEGSRLLDPEILPYGFLVGLFSSALPYGMDMLAMTRLSTQTFGVLSSLEPALAALSGFVFLGEKLNFVQLIAMTSIMIASAGATVSGQQNMSKQK